MIAATYEAFVAQAQVPPFAASGTNIHDRFYLSLTNLCVTCSIQAALEAMEVKCSEIEHNRGIEGPVVTMRPGSDRSYLHVSVHAHRCIDLTWLLTRDYERFVATFGTPEMISPGDSLPGVRVMCYEQLKGRLMLSTGEVTVQRRDSVISSPSPSSSDPQAPNEDPLSGVFLSSTDDDGDATTTEAMMEPDEAGSYFPTDFVLSSMPIWRVKKDKRQLIKLKLAERFELIRMRKKKKKKRKKESGQEEQEEGS